MERKIRAATRSRSILPLARLRSASSRRFTAAPPNQSPGGMRAAMAALQHQHPKLTTMAVNSMNGETFAAMLYRAIARSQSPPKLIEHSPEETAEGIAWTGPLRDRG